MAEDIRRSAEIRRMASQKVAAELIKCSTFAVGEDLDAGFSHFLDIVDVIDKDVVSAGDRALEASKPPDAATPPSTPQNGSDAPTEAGSDPLGPKAAKTVTELLAKVDPELLKLKLWEMKLPSTTIPEAVAAMSKEQAKVMMPWIKEHAVDKVES